MPYFFTSSYPAENSTHAGAWGVFEVGGNDDQIAAFTFTCL